MVEGEVLVYMCVPVRKDVSRNISFESCAPLRILSRESAQYMTTEVLLLAEMIYDTESIRLTGCLL